MLIKKMLSVVAAGILCVVTSITAFADTAVDREAYKDALFLKEYNHVSNVQAINGDYVYVPVEKNPIASLDYYYYCNYVDTLNDGELSQYNLSKDKDIESFYSKYIEWGDLVWEQDKLFDDFDTLEYNNQTNQWAIIRDEVKVRTFEEEDDEWKLVDEDGNEIGSYDKLYKFMYLNEEYEENVRKFQEEFEGMHESSSTSDYVEPDPVSKSTQIVTPTEADETSSMQVAAQAEPVTASKKSNSSNGIYAVIIVLIIVAGIVIIVINNNNKKK